MNAQTSNYEMGMECVHEYKRKVIKMNHIIQAMLPALQEAYRQWCGFWEGSWFYLLVLESILILILGFRKKEPTKEILPWVLLHTIFYFFPFTALLVQRLIGPEVYWRVLWLYPLIPLCALACTYLITSKGRSTRWILLAVCLAVICVSGKDVLSAGYFERMHNFQQVPTEIPHICRVLHEQEAVFGQDRVYIAADNHVATWVRVYDPSILQAYGRYGNGAVNSWAARIYEQMEMPEPDYDIIAENISNLTVNFVILPITDAALAQDICGYGWEMVGHINDYYIYYVTENGEELIAQRK